MSVFIPFGEGVRLFLIVTSLSLILIKGVLFTLGNADNWALVYFTSSLITLLHVYPLIAYKREYGWLHILIIFLIRHLLNEFSSLSYMGQPYQPHVVLSGWDQTQLSWVHIKRNVLYIIATLSIYIGYFTFSSNLWANIKPKVVSGFGSKLAIVMVVCVVLFTVFMISQGGISNWLLFFWGGGRSRAISSGQVAPGLWMIIIRLSVFGVLFWLARDVKALYSPLFWLYAILSSGMIFLITGSRSSFIGFGVYGLIIWMFRERKVTPFRALFFGLVAIVVVSVLGEFRRSTWSGEIDWGSLTDFSITEKFSGGIDEVNTRGVSKNGEFAILALAPEELELLYGESYFALLTAPIPRAIFPGKPQGAGQKLGDRLFGIRGGVPPGSVGEAFWNFHIPGVIMAYLLFGVFYRWIMNVIVANPREPTFWIIYAVLIYIFKNPSTLGFVYIAQQCLSILFLYWFFTFKRR